ncbi:MAG: hypothetical protein E7310_08360 [Clostridiales bacterium]|nr:hypothetical protein [Clostridiales bacterium]
MKKKTLFIVLGIILVLVIGGIALFSSLNKEKESMTASEFKTLMEGKGFVVSDATSQFSQYDYVEQVYVAAPSDYSYKIEFYELSDVEYATMFYNNNKSIFESSKGNASGETSVSMKNYSKYSLSTGGKFKVVSRIDNTVVYLNVDSNNKDTVKDLLDELGY